MVEYSQWNSLALNATLTCKFFSKQQGIIDCPAGGYQEYWVTTLFLFWNEDPQSQIQIWGTGPGPMEPAKPGPTQLGPDLSNQTWTNGPDNQKGTTSRVQSELCNHTSGTRRATRSAWTDKSLIWLCQFGCTGLFALVKAWSQESGSGATSLGLILQVWVQFYRSGSSSTDLGSFVGPVTTSPVQLDPHTNRPAQPYPRNRTIEKLYHRHIWSCLNFWRTSQVDTWSFLIVWWNTQYQIVETEYSDLGDESNKELNSNWPAAQCRSPHMSSLSALSGRLLAQLTRPDLHVAAPRLHRFQWRCRTRAEFH